MTENQQAFEDYMARERPRTKVERDARGQYRHHEARRLWRMWCAARSFDAANQVTNQPNHFHQPRKESKP